MKKKKSIFSRIFGSSDFEDDIAHSLIEPDLKSGFDFFSMGSQENSLLLGRYDSNSLKKLMSKVGLVDFLSRKGFDDLIVHISRDDSRVNYLDIYNKSITPENLLIDLRLSESRYIADSDFKGVGNEAYDSIVIEWLLTQNPERKEFKKDKPQLPGQKKPGLGCLAYLMKMMYYVTKQVTKDAFLDVPDHIHLAIIYSKEFKFYSPYKEGQLRAILRDLKDHSLIDIAWAAITNSITDTNSGEVYNYEPSAQLFPVSRRIKRYFKSKTYHEIFKNESKKHHYVIDMEKMKIEKERILKTKSMEEL